MPRRRKRAPAAARGLRWRRDRAYYELTHDRLEAGRLVKALGLHRDRAELAVTFAGALNTLVDRGDWSVLERWRRGEIDITDIVRAVREGEYARIRHIEGTRLGAAIDRFMERTRATASEQTVKNYDKTLRQLLNALGADYPMVSLTIAEAETFLHQKKETTFEGEPWAAQTQSSSRTVYAMLWGMVIEQEAEAAERAQALPAVVRNPWKRVRIAKRRKTRHAYLTPAQWKQLIEHPEVAGTPQAALMAAGILGLRRREIIYLRTDEDVILDGDRPMLRVQDRKGEHAWTTKTENSVRDVPIPPPLLPVFRHHRETFAGDAFFLRTYFDDAPMSDYNADLWAKRCFVAAGLPYGARDSTSFVLHSLRHTCATWLLSAGVPITTAAKRIGDTPAVMLSTYAHAMKDDEPRADRALYEALGGV